MDEIEKILQTTGLSCDELMKKLQCYRTVRINDNDEKSILKTDKTCMETVIIQNNNNNNNSTNNSYNNHNNKKNNGSITKNLQNGNEHQDEDSNNVNNTVSAQALDDCHDVEITTVIQCTNEDQDDDANKSGNVQKIEKKSDSNPDMIINDSVSKNGDPEEGNDTNKDRDKGNDTSEDRDKGNDTSEDLNKNNDTNKDRDNGGTEQKIVDDNNLSNQNTEDLINNIKLQLSSLRNKKKTNCYISDFNKKINTFTKKHKRIAEIPPTIDFNEQNNDNNLPKDPLITTTEETNFLIVNVSGGVDVTQENNCEKSENLKRKPHEKDKPDLSDSNCPQVKKIRLSEPIVKDNKTTTTTDDKNGNVDKSPFVSDSLENFLNEKQLKISYAIPKLGAEDGLMETTKPSPYDYKNNNCNMRPRGCFMKKQPVKPIKARTLAEMRRQMERMKSAENSQENCEIQPKKNTILSRNSYVLYKNKKIWLPAIKQNHCVGTVEDYQTIMRRRKNTIDGNKNRKLSLLSAMFQQTKLPKISYKPGPLSKKIELQTKESCKYWKTELKKLPKIYFEVIPEINKPIDRRFLHLLPIFDDNIITKERADFALSVLKQPENKQQIFKFPVPYKNNQEQLAVCRPILYNNNRINVNNCDKLKKDNSSDIGIVIKNILDDMIRYVETKEISDDLIRDDDIIYNDDNNNNKDNDNNKQKNFVKKKRKRIDAELQRLNCKIINLENDNNNLNDDQYCNKPYCKLGCICKSLQCEPILLNHCQRLDCMFNCKCPKKQENSLLDEYKMNHLNEQVKKNLAKVEREFTQTIIQQGNEMYVVGNTGDYKKMKRTSKAPKRYHDYEYDFNNKPTTPTATTIPKKPPEIDYNLKECRVDLIKLNLNNVVPLCLQHFHHNCYCGGFMIDNRSTNKTDDSSARIRPVYSKYRERHKHPIYKTKTFYKKKIIVDKLSDNINNHNNKNDEFETISITNDDIQPTTSNNNNTKFSKRKQAFVKIREDLDENSSIGRRCSLNNKSDKSKIPSNSGYNRVFEGEIQVPLKQNLHMLNIIGNKNSHLEYLRILPWNSLIKGYNNNKIKIWCTLGRPYTLLCNKYYAVPPKNCISINKLTTLSPTPAVKNDIVKWILNNKLPPNRCAIKTFAILVPTKNHFSIAGLCERNSDEQEALTKSLLKTVSTTTTTTTTTTVNSAISVPAEVTSPPSSSSPSPPPPPPPKTAQSAAFSSLLSSLSHTSSLLAITENRGMKWKHKDMNNEVQILFITNRHFALKLFYYNTNNNDNLEIALPKVAKTSKWYMIYLKSDFTYLLFKKCNYTIKYTDLLEFINMSKNLQKTIMIKNEKIVNNYLDVKKFGIYCVPQFQDRLFIGPFLNDEEHNIDTLRYINRQLFDTKIFQQIQGKSGNYNNPVWIYEWKQWYKPYSHTSTVKENINNNNDIIIISNTKLNDTTNNNSDNKGNDNDDDDDDVIILDDPIVPTEPSKTQSNISYDNVNGEVFMLPFVKELNSDDVKNRTANRFIITNIPHLGYLEAHQYETQIIDVFWPERIKVYRFINVKFAKYSLIHYFSQIFCPVNEDFKISVVILTEIDSNVNKPMDIKYIIDPGPFICGDFGVYSEETAPQEFLKAHKINSINQLLRLDQRVEESFDRLVQLFGLFLMTTSEQQQFKTTKEILDWAISEIYVMKRLSGNYEAEKTDLQYLRRFKFLKIKKMLLALPLDERKKHYDQIMAIKQSQRLPITNRASYVNRKKRINEMEITETIEIKDSDDEEDVDDDERIEKNTEQVETNDGKTDKLKQLAKIGTVVQPVFQQVTNSGIIQKGGNTILNKSLLKNRFTPTRTYLIAKKINGDSFKIVNTRNEIVKNLDNSAKVVNNIITNVAKERA